MDHRERIAQLSRNVGNFHIACRRLDAPGEFVLRDLETVPIASMYKVLLALEVADAFERGDLAPDTILHVVPAQHSPGGFGVTEFAYPVDVALRDLLYMSLAWSDNTSADLLLELVGLDAVVARARGLGLASVGIVGGCRTLLSNAGRDFGYVTDTEAELSDWVPTSDASDLLLDRTTRASVADLSRLAELIDAESAASPGACRLVRDLMSRQIWTTRFAYSFPTPGWTRATKTGTLSPWRGEFGILCRADGARFALAVVVRQHYASSLGDVVDRAVSAVASSAIAIADNYNDLRYTPRH
jgi:beta-lactamase class A